MMQRKAQRQMMDHNQKNGHATQTINTGIAPGHIVGCSRTLVSIYGSLEHWNAQLEKTWIVSCAQLWLWHDRRIFGLNRRNVSPGWLDRGPPIALVQEGAEASGRREAWHA